MVLETNIVEEFKNSSTIHGLSRFGGPELYTKRRQVWVLLVLLSAGGLVVFLILEFVHLSEHPTNTIFATKLQESLEFPAITICNLNQVKKSILKCLTEADEQEIHDVFYTLSELSLIVKHYDQIGALHSTQISGQQLHECIMNHSHSLDRMASSCHFKEELLDCATIFTPRMTEYGMCYTFNANSTRFARAIGETSGLRLFVNIEHDEYFFSSTIRAGIKVVLHDPAEDPLPSFRGFLVGPGLSAACSMKKSVVTTLPEPYGSCRESTEKLGGVGTYSEITCYKRCFDEYISRKCGCRHLFLEGSLEYCDSVQLIDCYARYIKNLTRDTNVIKQCTCLPSCRTLKYDASLSYARFSSDIVADLLYNRSILPDRDYIGNLIDLRMFYNTLIEEDITEVPEKSFGSILGTLGGQMGMFIGASILSIIELIEFCFLMMSRAGRRVTSISTKKKGTSQEELDTKTTI